MVEQGAPSQSYTKIKVTSLQKEPVNNNLLLLPVEDAIRPRQSLRFERGISADTALRLAHYFGMSVDFWTGIQVHYDTEMAKMQLGDRFDDLTVR